MTGWGRLASARDLRDVLRLADQRGEDERDPLKVEAVMMTTHDLNLRFVLTELLPGFLEIPGDVPPGIGPGHRSYCAAMLDLCPTAIVYALEASTSCETPWRPPGLRLFAYRGDRRQHSKIAAILYERREDRARVLRLIATSANLTRRAYATNLEVAAYEDYVLGDRKYPSLHELSQLLQHLAAGSKLGDSDAFRVLNRVLPTGKGKRTSQRMHFVQSSDPAHYKSAIGGWLSQYPNDAGAYERAVIVSPFFSASGDRLHTFFKRDLGFDGCDGPIDVIVDGRDSASRDKSGAFTTPPAWLEEYRGDGSATHRPALLSGKRGHDELRGTGCPGRSLHAKLLGVGYTRKGARKKRLVWRVLAGSSNFTESGLGLAGANSSIEAGFLLEHHEREANDLFGPQTSADASLCVEHSYALASPDRVAPALDRQHGEVRAGKRVFRALDERALTIEPGHTKGYRLTITLEATLCEGIKKIVLGREQHFETESLGRYALETDSLAPYRLQFTIGETAFEWPIPVEEPEVYSALLSASSARTRNDRLLQYWLRHAGADVDPDDDASDSALTVGGAIGDEHETPLGSWRLNRLLLGVRRRLAESVNGVPPRLPSHEGLLAAIRVRELLERVKSLPEADRLYAAILLRAMLLGHATAPLKPRRLYQEALEGSIIEAWRTEERWMQLETQLKQDWKLASTRARAALKSAAESLFRSVQTGEVCS